MNGRNTGGSILPGIVEDHKEARDPAFPAPRPLDWVDSSGQKKRGMIYSGWVPSRLHKEDGTPLEPLDHYTKRIEEAFGNLLRDLQSLVIVLWGQQNHGKSTVFSAILHQVFKFQDSDRLFGAKGVEVSRFSICAIRPDVNQPDKYFILIDMPGLRRTDDLHRSTPTLWGSLGSFFGYTSVGDKEEPRLRQTYRSLLKRANLSIRVADFAYYNNGVDEFAEEYQLLKDARMEALGTFISGKPETLMLRPTLVLTKCDQYREPQLSEYHQSWFGDERAGDEPVLGVLRRDKQRKAFGDIDETGDMEHLDYFFTGFVGSEITARWPEEGFGIPEDLRGVMGRRDTSAFLEKIQAYFDGSQALLKQNDDLLAAFRGRGIAKRAQFCIFFYTGLAMASATTNWTTLVVPETFKTTSVQILGTITLHGLYGYSMCATEAASCVSAILFRYLGRWAALSLIALENVPVMGALPAGSLTLLLLWIVFMSLEVDRIKRLQSEAQSTFDDIDRRANFARLQSYQEAVTDAARENDAYGEVRDIIGSRTNLCGDAGGGEAASRRLNTATQGILSTILNRREQQEVELTDLDATDAEAISESLKSETDAMAKEAEAGHQQDSP
mmetsp:Transcript_13153/g.48796  ORF Transcript_13153/g.48796 Transcript_13153/m.48796 type:complete len:612 (-) Transcript_13153:594-2429(-)